MLPRWHVLFGAIFTGIIWYFAPGIKAEYLALIFLSSVFIDLDHYINAVMKNKSLHLQRAFDYHKEEGKKAEDEKKKGIRKRGDFHLFHTLEFHLFIGILGIFFPLFFYIFTGILFHSLLDLLYLLKKDYVYRREYFLVNWLGRRM